MTTEITLTRAGLRVPAGAMDAATLTALRRACTVSTRGFGDRIVSQQCWHSDPGLRAAPVTVYARARALRAVLRAGRAPRIDMTAGDEIATGTHRVQLKPYQEPLFAHLTREVWSEAAVALGLSTALLSLAPGRGKTYLAAAVIAWCARCTLYVVPGRDLLTQTAAVLRTLFPALRVGEYGGGRTTDGEIVVMTSATAASSATFRLAGAVVAPSVYFERFGLTILDEVHTLCTRERSAAFTRCASRYVLGMSGTCAHRLDGMDPVMYNYVGRPVDCEHIIAEWEAARTVTEAVAVAPWQLQATCLRYTGPERWVQSILSAAGTVSAPLMVTQFSCDPWRTQLLVDTVERTLAQGHRTFVLLDRTRLVELTCAYLRTRIPDGVGTVTGGTATAERNRARTHRVVVGTYACLGTGISWDEFSAIVFWHPRRNKFEQFLNRVFREGGDRTRERCAIYLQDNATTLKSQYSGFRGVCKKERGVTPTVEAHHWSTITVSAEIAAIAREFAEHAAVPLTALELAASADAADATTAGTESDSDSAPGAEADEARASAFAALD